MTRYLKKSLLAALALALIGNASGLGVKDLRTDYRETPLGVDRFPIKLFWKLDAGESAAALQTAYQIQSADSEEALLSRRALQWDSGKVDSPKNTQVIYAGAQPESRQRVWWRVRIWDETDTPGDWSAPSWFETGLLEEVDWQGAEWIGGDRDIRAPHPAPEELMGDWITAPEPEEFNRLYLDFELPDKPVTSAMCYWVLDQPAAAGLRLNFGSIHHDLRRYVQKMVRGGHGGFYDMAFCAKPGETNRIELMFRRPVSGIAASIGARIVFADGEEMIIRSDAKNWSASLTAKPPRSAPVRLADTDAPKVGIMPETDLAPIWLSKEVEVKRGLSNARLYLCALGSGIPYLNGERIDDSYFSPPQSDWEEFAFYTIQDVTPQLRQGSNQLAVLLDAAWMHEIGGFGVVLSYGRPGMIAALALDYEDGSTEWITSGEDWKWKVSHLSSANIYRGERVDYRMTDQPWQSVQTLPPLSPELVATDVEPVRPDAEIEPQKTWKIGEKTWLVDFGELVHGTIRLNFNEPAGSKIYLRYSEYAEDGELWNTPLSHWRFHGITQMDIVTADGRDRVFENLFATKSFRFVEICGLNEEPTAEDLSAIRVATDADTLISFESSDPMLNRLFENGIRTARNYMVNMFGDLPRERCLWGAESTYTWRLAFNGLDWAPNNRLMTRLWYTGRKAPGGVPGNIGVGLRGTTATNDFTWSISPLYLSRKMYDHYGDIEILREFHTEARHILRHYESKATDGLLPHIYKHGDISSPSGIERVESDKQFVAALNFFDAQQNFVRLSTLLGEEADAEHARSVANRLRDRLLQYYDEANHTFNNGVENSLALAADLLQSEEENRKLAASTVEIYRANGHKSDGGFLGHEIYPMLARYGYVDDALKMMTNTECPGAAFTIANYDATTYHEAYHKDKWEQMRQGLGFIVHSHPTSWMINDLVGIRPDSLVPGGRRLIFAPAIPEGYPLDWAKGSLITAQGTAHSKWRRGDGVIEWEFTVPPNTIAEIHAPAELKANYNRNGITRFDSGKENRFEAKPGTYRLTFDVAR